MLVYRFNILRQSLEQELHLVGIRYLFPVLICRHGGKILFKISAYITYFKLILIFLNDISDGGEELIIEGLEMFSSSSFVFLFKWAHSGQDLLLDLFHLATNRV